MQRYLFYIIFFISSNIFPVIAQDAPRTTIDLNGDWAFEQTSDAFPPQQFSRICPVPGLIHLARPKIDQYDIFFQRPDEPISAQSHNLMNLDYEPRYSWYKREIEIPESLKNKEAVITIKKSQYVTQVYVNGMDVGKSMECYTPIDLPVTDALNFGDKNEILIRVGDRAWLPSQAAGSTDKEKIHYLPGIWDDVLISFTDKLRIHKSLILPDNKEGKVDVKLQIRSFYPPQMEYGDPMNDSCRIKIKLVDPEDQKVIGETSIMADVKRDNITFVNTSLPVTDFQSWTPDNPKLYRAEISVVKDGQIHDSTGKRFGIRDFERKGKHFYLNNEKIFLRGTNITLQRFFEDPDCAGLVWDREWVKELLIDIPKEKHWNAMRICVGIVPDFWYDIADEYGMMFQNEWFYWQNHGWDEQVRKEYTDWVWSDGSHPSIVIWDAINENWDPFIGKVLIPELKELDPTRIWDAGYMTSSDMMLDEMDEPHTYRAGWNAMVAEDIGTYFKNNPYRLGDLDDWPERFEQFREASAAQLVNEYGWIWLWRDGRPAKLTKTIYDHLLGESATPQQRRNMQAYWLQLETEWNRSERSFAGVLAFTHLTNNFGFTGDWFVGDIEDLEEAPALKWFEHAFAPTAVFIDLADQRYLNNGSPYQPGEDLTFNLVGINDLPQDIRGKIALRIIDKDGVSRQVHSANVELEASGKHIWPVNFSLPDKKGAYLLVAEFSQEGNNPVFSRRYLDIGRNFTHEEFIDTDPEP